MLPERRRYKAEIVAKYVAASAEAVAAREAAEVSHAMAPSKRTTSESAPRPQGPVRRGCRQYDTGDGGSGQHDDDEEEEEKEEEQQQDASGERWAGFFRRPG
eukprot:COSAG01_NODE_35299_length_534_cov_0.627586_2_plen_101_part_01